MAIDSAFFQEIEDKLSNIGNSDVVWNRKIAGKVFKLSPIPYFSQFKINEMMNSRELGANIMIEIKRITLSYAISGIDNIDFLKFRDFKPSFPQKSKEGKTVSVPLNIMLEGYMKNWGAQLIDDIFTVYSDLMESHQKSNLKDIEFDNVKDPEVELSDLESRVQELRKNLGKPKLVESSGSEEESESSEEGESTEEEKEDFDPFKRIDPPSEYEEEEEVVVQESPFSVKDLESDEAPFIEESPIPEAKNVPVRNDVLEPKVKVNNTPVLDPNITHSVNPRFKKA